MYNIIEMFRIVNIEFRTQTLIRLRLKFVTYIAVKQIKRNNMKMHRIPGPAHNYNYFFYQHKVLGIDYSQSMTNIIYQEVLYIFEVQFIISCVIVVVIRLIISKIYLRAVTNQSFCILLVKRLNAC